MGHSKNNILTFKHLFFHMTVGVWAALEAWMQQTWLLCYEIGYLWCKGDGPFWEWDGKAPVVLKIKRVCPLGSMNVLTGFHTKLQIWSSYFFLCVHIYSGAHQKHQALQWSIWRPRIITPNLCWTSNCWNFLLWQHLTDWAKVAIMILAFKHSQTSHKSHIKLIFARYLLLSVFWKAHLDIIFQSTAL